MNSRLRSLCLTALFAALLAIGAWVTIPIGVPPYTMQSFVLYCALWLLRPRQSFAAVALYLLIGAVGLPVFAGFQGGLGVLVGPTGGYLFGFLLMPLVMAAAKPTALGRLLCAALGTLCCYALGTAWYVCVYSEPSTVTVGAEIARCVLPFLLPDAVKLALACVVGTRLEPHLKRM